jgi:hypothetical protein
MNRNASVVLGFLSFLAVLSLCLSVPALAADTSPKDRLSLAGAIKNLQGKGVKEVEVEVLLGGRHLKPEGKEEAIITGSQGNFLAVFLLPPGTLPGERLEVKAAKSAWRDIAPTPVTAVPSGVDAKGNSLFQAQTELTMKRQITPAFWLAALVLLLVYVIIAAELMHRTLAALLGAAVILFISYTVGTFNKNFFILSFDDAMTAMDMNVIFLLMGMMIVVGILKKTGLFQWLAYKSYALARGNVFILSAILMVITAVASAFLDNVTTMLLMIPVTIQIAVTLKINPIALLIPEVFASNVGGPPP